MPRIVISAAADRDIISILDWTFETFGEVIRSRYEALLVRAIARIRDDPECAGSVVRPEIQRPARTYHLIHSRGPTKQPNRIKNPRHFLLYRVRDDGVVELGRVLHDSMDFDRHLPEGYERIVLED